MPNFADIGAVVGPRKLTILRNFGIYYDCTILTLLISDMRDVSPLGHVTSCASAVLSKLIGASYTNG